MKTIRQLIYGEVIAKVGFATMGFIGLFFFFDLVDELKWIGQGPGNAYAVRHALAYVLLLVPGHVYELMPITVLIGTIFVMARFAQSSEFTILRTSGLGPVKALRTLLGLGLGFVVLTFVVGDYLTPVASRQAQLIKARYLGEAGTQGITGAWLKESHGNTSSVVNVAALGADGQLIGVRVFEFDAKGKMTHLIRAGLGEVQPDGSSWLLKNVQRDQFQSTPANGRPQIQREQLPEWRWENSLSEEMVSVALLRPERMATVELFNYIQHLRSNEQASQRYEIDFWKKVFYPLSCLVMVVLALPFAYLHFRSGGIAGYVFGGVMAGKSMVVQPVESNGRTIYRLRAYGLTSEDDARNFCAALQAEGTECVPVAQR